MRIIAGGRRGKKLKSPAGMTIRPTSDRTREAVFNILGREISDRTVLDLFAGTGALGIEALSRGAAAAVFVDGSHQAIRIIHSNLEICGLYDAAKVCRLELPRRIGALKAFNPTYDLVFMDPPYDKGLVSPTLNRLSEHGLLANRSRIVIEHSESESAAPEDPGFVTDSIRKYGKCLVTIMTYML